MKSRLAVSLMFAVCFAVALDAQDKRPANPVRAVGRVIALTPSEITVQTGKQPNLVLMIDTGTKVVGKEFGTRSQNLKRDGKPVTVPDLLDQFDSVIVKYVDDGGKLRATDIDIKSKTTLKK